MRKWMLAGLGALALLAIAATAVYTLRFQPSPPPAAQPAPAQTATIVRMDLSTSVTLNGSLGYGSATTFTGGRSGTVTWLPAVGTVVDRGRPLYDVDATPVVLFLGATPLYRTVNASATPGPDIAEVNANLRDLGYDDAPTGDAYTSGTENALKAWQKRDGLPQTGTLAVGDVAVLPAPVRVAALDVQPGAQGTAALLGLTSTTKLVTAAVDPTQVDTGTLTHGLAVSLSLPDNAQTTGTISSLSASGSPGGQGSSGGGTGSGTQTMTLTVAIGDQAAASGMDSGSVGVTGTTSMLVGVRTGMFDNGLVEISGQGVIAGLKVVAVS